MIQKHAIKCATLKEALLQLRKYPGNQIVEQDGSFYIQFSNEPIQKPFKVEMREVLWGKILPKWIPNTLLATLGIRTLLIDQYFLQDTVIYQYLWY